MGKTPPEDDLPAEVLALGEPRTVFRGNSRTASDLFLVLTLMILLLTLVVGFALYGVIRVPEQITVGAALMISGMILVLIGVIVAAYLRGRAILGLRYALCPGGLARVRGMRVDVLPWEGLEVYIWPTAPFRGAPHRCVLINGGTRWSLSGEVARVNELCVAVSEEMIRRNLTDYKKRIGRGDEIDFGPIAISSRGLAHDGRLLSWDSLAAIDERRKMTGLGLVRDFHIRQALSNGSWTVLSADQLPNLGLLFALIGERKPTALRAGPVVELPRD